MRKLLLSAALLAGFTLAGGEYTIQTATAAAPGVTQEIAENAALKFDELHKDFGRVEEGERVTITYNVKNVSDQTVNITQIRPTCGCTAASGNPEQIKPGEETQIKLLFNSSGRLGEQYKNARIITDDPNQSDYTISFEGKVTTDLQFKEQFLDFGDVEQGDPVTKRFTLISRAEKPIKILGVEPDDNRLEARLVPEEELKKEADDAASEKEAKGKEKEEENAKEYVFEVTIPEDFPQSNLFTRVNVKTDHPSKKSVGLSLRARVMGDVIASPNQLVAVVEPGGTMERFVTLTARKASNIEVLSVEAGEDIEADFMVEDMPNQPNMKRLKAVFHGTEEPARLDDEATVKMRTESGKEIEVKVPLIMVVRQAYRPQREMPGLPQKPTNLKEGNGSSRETGSEGDAAKAPKPIGPELKPIQ